MSTKERPMIFSGPMVRAILDGRKTQTRRAVKNVKHPDFDCWMTPGELSHESQHVIERSCPYGAPGDRLWVRETWADVNSEMGPSLLYKADGCLVGWEDFSETFDKDYGAGPSMDYNAYPGDYLMWWSDLWEGHPGHRWRSPIHMPRWASRITLEIVSVRVERLQDITEADARAEGFPITCNGQSYDPPPPEVDSWQGYGTASFFLEWSRINGKRHPWASNPWVRAIEFRRIA